MSILSHRWRARSAELDTALPPLLTSPGVTPAVVQATKAAVLSELYLAMADMLDALKSTSPLDETVAAKVNLNSQVRMAAVKGLAEGKWDEFDRIVDSFGTGSAAKPGDGTNT